MEAKSQRISEWKNILIFFNRLVHKQTESRFKPKDWFCLFECTWAQNSIEDHSTIIKRITDFIKSKLSAKGKDRAWPHQHISDTRRSIRCRVTVSYFPLLIWRYEQTLSLPRQIFAFHISFIPYRWKFERSMVCVL